MPSLGLMITLFSCALVTQDVVTSRQRVVEEQIQKLSNDSPHVRDAAEHVLLKEGYPAEHYLRAALEGSKDPELTLRLSRVLGVYRLQKLLGVSVGMAFASADTILAKFAIIAKHLAVDCTLARDPEGLRCVIRELCGSSATTTQKLQLVSEIVEKQIYPCREVLITFLRDEQPDVRACAACGLADLKGQNSAADIAPLLSDLSSQVRCSALRALARLKAKDHAERIAKLLEDADPNVRHVSASSLGSLNLREFIPAIAKLLKDGDPTVRGGSARVLCDLNAEECEADILNLLKDEDRIARLTAALAVGGWRKTGHHSKLEPLLKDDESIVRRAAIIALSHMESRVSSDQICNLLWDVDTQVRCDAAETLGTLGSIAHVEPLKRASQQEPNEDVKRALARAIERLQKQSK